ncbi:MAG: class I SAM-dependent methyltransferase [Magnetococcales bacterium]|nr:class I SAM-dependent methyltransferase [Magnetococcales bacterium]
MRALYWSLRKWLANPHRSWLELLKWQNKYFAQLACRGMAWRGFSAWPLHPKHLFDPETAAHAQRFMAPGMRVLDVGCGSGAFCLKACELGAASVVGLEHDAESVRQLRAVVADRGVPVEVLAMDLERTPYPFEEGSFDLIHCSDVLEHLHRRVECLVELRRIKKSGAPIVVSIPNTDTTWKRRLRQAGIDSRDDTDHKIEYTEETLRAEIARAGLRLEGPLLPVVPSFPWHGLLALSAVVSPAWYRRAQRWKYAHARRHPEESMGWVFHVM